MSNHAALRGMLDSGNLEPYIRHVRFPRFKNLDDGLQIDFQHPITALVGPNGTNKSSILRALEGCPELQNIGNHWFSTNLDPIEPHERHRYIHGYNAPSGLLVEAVKMRVMKRNPDYFETSKPRVRDGMAPMPRVEHTNAADRDSRTKTRWKSIGKEVLYLDFRQEIPAYDILFYFDWRRAKRDTNAKKKLVRQRSVHVSTALESLEDEHDLFGKNRILESAVSLSSEEVIWVSKILDREYTSIRLVKHDFFEVEGYTAQLKTKHLKYSEAFAGSGEFAAIMLVHSMWTAPEKCLVLMDEPEVSLHPGAQASLMEFVEIVCKRRRLQVVLSTHSAAIIETLPPAAIKVLTHNAMTGRVSLAAQSADAQEAFSRIGALSTRRQIYVEDQLAKAIVERAARSISDLFVETIDVQPLPGGANGILTSFVPTMAALGSSAAVILDGDQRIDPPLTAGSKVPDSELSSELKRLGIQDKHVHRDGGNADNTAQLQMNQRAILDWVGGGVGYLPSDVPENLLLEMEGQAPLAAAGAKAYWVGRTAVELGLSSSEAPTAQQILDTQRRMLASVPDENPSLKECADILKTVLRSV